jgi:hypothetical protein
MKAARCITPTHRPRANAKNVQKKPSARAGGVEAASASQRTYALQQAVKNFPVVDSTSEECGEPREQGMDLMTKRGVPFAETVAAKQGEIHDLIEVAGAARVPLMVVDVTMQKAYEEESWNEALDTA